MDALRSQGPNDHQLSHNRYSHCHGPVTVVEVPALQLHSEAGEIAQVELGQRRCTVETLSPVLMYRDTSVHCSCDGIPVTAGAWDLPGKIASLDIVELDGGVV